MKLKLFRLYISTLCHLKPSQLFYLTKQRLPFRRACKELPHTIQVRPEVSLGPCLDAGTNNQGDNGFQFLNVSRDFPDGQIDWVCTDMPKLWCYNLHYFDYLHDESRSGASLKGLVSDWIASNPVGGENAWEPYTVSLRIVNWAKWFLIGPFSRSIPHEFNENLYLQAAWLEQNIEYHLLANHYLKNGKALFFAGVYFDGKDAERWLKAGLKILSSEADEQILPDGGHIERSPMYHCIVVEDYLDVLNLIMSNPGLVEPSCMEKLRVKTIAALGFLNAIVMPDNEIPLFNDSAFGIAPEPERLFEYASKLIGYQRTRNDGVISATACPDTGYYVIRDNEDMLIIDCGRIGPDYQPGHAHCDTLSYELCLGGRRVVVDAGVYDYENSDTRRYARGTSAHNTVMLDGQEQSEIWGVFRVARRAIPVGACSIYNGDGHVTFVGSHDGYQRLAGKVTHERVVEYENQKGWQVKDNLLGKGLHEIENFIHLAPDLSLEMFSGSRLAVIVDKSGSALAELELPDNLECELINGEYFPGFGISSVNHVIRLHGEVKLPFATKYKLRVLSCVT